MNDYSEYGGRNAYLESLANDFGVDPMVVFILADMFGPSEDFDGLICELEDYISYGGY